MQGSSAFQFGRAAYRAGLMGRRQLLADGVANVRFRLRGATDADSVALRDRIAASLEGTRVVDLERLGTDVLAGILPRVYPQMMTIAHEHQDAGRRAYIVTAAVPGAGRNPGPGDGVRWRDRLAGLRGRRRRLHRAPHRRVRLPCGKARAIEELAAREDIDLSASYAYSDSSQTCRCCAPSATRWPSTPTASWPGSRAARDGRCFASTGSGAGSRALWP